MDFRGYGESGRRSGRLGYDSDVVAAARALRARGINKIVLIGASMGGTAVLTAAAKLDPAPPVVALSAPAEFLSMDARASISAVSFPILLLASIGDTEFAGDQQTLYQAARTTDKFMELEPGYEHGIEMLTGKSRLRALNLMFGFLARQTRT